MIYPVDNEMPWYEAIKYRTKRPDYIQPMCRIMGDDLSVSKEGIEMLMSDEYERELVEFTNKYAPTMQPYPYQQQPIQPVAFYYNPYMYQSVIPYYQQPVYYQPPFYQPVPQQQPLIDMCRVIK